MFLQVNVFARAFKAGKQTSEGMINQSNLKKKDLEKHLQIPS